MVTWLIVVERISGKVVAIVMNAGTPTLLTARFDVAKPQSNPTIDDYWDNWSPEQIKQVLTEDFELFEYDLDCEDDDYIGLQDLQPDNELAWEIPLVQQWVMGKQLSRSDLESITFHLGRADLYSVEEVLKGQLYSRLVLKEAPPAPQKISKLTAHCLWCDVPVKRIYNFSLPSMFDPGDPEDPDECLLWSDGIWTELGQDPESFDRAGCQYEESIIECSICGAAYLASMLEQTFPERQFHPDFQGWSEISAPILPGNCDEGFNSYRDLDAKVTWASLERTREYLSLVQASGTLITWEEWTAVQQAVNIATNLDRKAKATYATFSLFDEEGLKDAIRTFLPKIGQIKAGTLGSMSPFPKHSQTWQENENYSIHNYAVDETLPVANMLRICGYGNYDWAVPSHPALRDPQNMDQWSELDQWIAKRGSLLLLALERGITDWAVAAAPSGNLFSWARYQ